jgi:hypothetical protein
MAADKNFLVVSASQGTRGSIDSYSIRQTDVSQDIRKLAHVNVMIGINQTEEEKSEQALRVNLLAHRNRRMSRGEVKILYSFETGQPVLDSEWVDYGK